MRRGAISNRAEGGLIADERLLKRDALGSVSLVVGAVSCVRRDTRRAGFWLRPLARRLAAREAAALSAAEGIEGVPRLLQFDGRTLLRAYVDGRPMHEARPRSPVYFAAALTLLRRLHRGGIAHNDLAKEANWLCTPNGRPALVDFQLAWRSARRGRLFRSLAREDLRHLLKHKQTYLPERLTARQRAMLADPSVTTRFWRAAIKPCYRFVTRRLLGWEERGGPWERQGSRR